MRWTLTSLLLLISCSVLAFPDGPEPGYSGGMGEPSCNACHFAGPAQSERSGIRLIGLAETVVANESYQLELEVSDPTGRVAGFQITFRDEKGESVGEWIAAEKQTVTRKDKVDYLAHTAPRPMEASDHGEQASRWQLVWKAPAILEEGSLLIHAAVVAGNDDDSPLGDNVYELKREIHPGDGI